MGTLIRAVTGFAIALTLLHGSEFWSGLKGQALQKVQSDIEASHPAARIQASIIRVLAPQNGTTPQK
jgi:hypothetical protein